MSATMILLEYIATITVMDMETREKKKTHTTAKQEYEKVEPLEHKSNSIKSN